MDKRLFELLSEVLPQANQFSELLVRRMALIPSYATIDGKDLKAVLDSKSFESFLQEDANKMLFNKKIITTKDELLKLFEGLPEEAKEYYEYSISILRRIILSLTNLAPTKIEDRDIKVQESIKRFLFATTNYLPYWENSIQSSSDFFNQSSDSINPQGSKIIFWVMMTGLISLNIMTITSIHFHNIVYEYFYGPTDKQDENADMINQISNNIAQSLSMQLNSIKKDTEQIAKKTELLLNSRETKNESLKAIKENQEKIKEIVKDRNEMDAEKTGTLSVEECVVIIGLITKHYFDLKQRDCKAVGFPLEVVKMPKESTIRRNIEFWDQYQNGNKAKGRKPPRKDYSRKKSKEKIGEWYNEIQLDQYNKWKAKNRIDALIGKSKKRFGDE